MAEVKRVVLFGTESTGKTLLAQALAVHFAAPWAPEFVRDFWDTHGGKITAADLDAIARGQVANEEEVAARASRVVFCDTDLLTCTLWDDLLFPGACPRWAREEAERRAKATALYLLCAADVPFAPDPQRCFADAESREGAASIWKAALVSRRLPFVEIRGNWAKRQKTAIAAVEKILV
jgi:HTH-type transcriptional regulator, transcriptional repressor of NAD biosynthesis genes